MSAPRDIWPTPAQRLIAGLLLGLAMICAELLCAVLGLLGRPSDAFFVGVVVGVLLIAVQMYALDSCAREQAREREAGAFRAGVQAHENTAAPYGWWFADDGADPARIDRALAAYRAQVRMVHEIAQRRAE